MQNRNFFKSNYFVRKTPKKFLMQFFDSTSINFSVISFHQIPLTWWNAYSCLTATPKTLLDTLQQFVGAPVSFWPCQWNLTKKTYSKWSYYSTDHKNYIIFLFEHFLSRLLDPQKSTFGDVILEVKLFLNEVIKK